MSFWEDDVQNSKPLTAEDLQAAFDAVKKMPAQTCPHLHPYSYVEKLKQAGETTARCLFCHQLCRL